MSGIGFESRSYAVNVCVCFKYIVGDREALLYESVLVMLVIVHLHESLGEISIQLGFSCLHCQKHLVTWTRVEKLRLCLDAVGQ